MVGMPTFRGVLAVVVIGCSSPPATPPPPCDAGTWASDPSTACVAWSDCPAGTYVASDGTTTSDRVCTACGDGAFNTATNAASCATWIDCAPGDYVSTAGTTMNDRTCGACQTGAFSATANATACTPWTTCPGFHTTAGTSTTDELCGANTLELGTGEFDEANAVALDGNGNIYVAGETTGAFADQTNLGSYDAFVVQYDASGTLQWIRQFGTSTVDSATAIAVDSNNNVYVAGYTFGTFPGETNAGGDDAFLAKYDATGTLQWAHQVGTSLGDYANSVAVDGNGNVSIAGYTAGAFPGETNAGNVDAFVAQFDANGALQWAHQLGTSSFDVAYSVAVDSNGSVYIAGNADVDAFLAQYSAAGTFQWMRAIGTGANTVAYGIAIDGGDNIYVAGDTNGTFVGTSSAGGEDGFVVCYDTTSASQWARQFGTSSPDSVASVAVDGSGNIEPRRLHARHVLRPGELRRVRRLPRQLRRAGHAARAAVRHERDRLRDVRRHRRQRRRLHRRLHLRDVFRPDVRRQQRRAARQAPAVTYFSSTASHAAALASGPTPTHTNAPRGHAIARRSPS